MYFFVIYIIPYQFYEVILHYKAKKEKKKNIVISAHPEIDPGLLVPKFDTLSSRPRCQVIRGSKNSRYWTDNPSIGHFPNRIQRKNFETFYIVDVALFGTETIVNRYM